jgi:hypothetical protein
MTLFDTYTSALKAMLFVESPSAFRRRMIFVSRDALSRPREQTGPVPCASLWGAALWTENGSAR